MPLWLILFSLSQGCRLCEALSTTPGLSLTIVRTYDSFNPRDGDFGVGWSFALSDLDVEFNEDRALLKAVDSDETVDARVGGGRDATLTLPDGRRTTFRFRFESMPSLNFGHAAVWDGARSFCPGNLIGQHGPSRHKSDA